MRYESPAGTSGMEGHGDTTATTVADSPCVTFPTPGANRQLNQQSILARFVTTASPGEPDFSRSAIFGLFSSKVLGD
jgi:hypothetical protein